MDSSVEVSKDFVVIYFFQIEECSETESTVRLHDRSLNGGVHVARIACICHVQVGVHYIFCLVITGSPTLTLRVSFF